MKDDTNLEISLVEIWKVIDKNILIIAAFGLITSLIVAGFFALDEPRTTSKITVKQYQIDSKPWGNAIDLEKLIGQSRCLDKHYSNLVIKDESIKTNSVPNRTIEIVFNDNTLESIALVDKILACIENIINAEQQVRHKRLTGSRVATQKEINDLEVLYGELGRSVLKITHFSKSVEVDLPQVYLSTLDMLDNKRTQLSLIEEDLYMYPWLRARKTTDSKFLSNLEILSRAIVGFAFGGFLATGFFFIRDNLTKK